MSLRSWAHFFPPYPGPAIPPAFRLVCAAVSGAALSLSYTGFYFSIYSWLCIGLLLVVILDARPHIAFACGFAHSLLLFSLLSPGLPPSSPSTAVSPASAGGEFYFSSLW